MGNDRADAYAAIESIADEDQLEDLLSTPTPEVVELFGRLQGDLLLLGAGGKIGPTLAQMAARATQQSGRARRIVAVVRRPDEALQAKFARFGIEMHLCDMMDRTQLAQLPEVQNVIYLAAMKFGTTGQEAVTWALNTYLPGLVSERFPRSRIVAYSTGNVYPLVPVHRGGSREVDPPAPIGEYAMSCLGRERIFTYFSQKNGTPVAIIRLNYANELRYGVLVDIAQKVLAGQPVELGMGYFNAIWQGDANAMVLRALEHVAVPPLPINVAGAQALRVRDVAEQFARLFGKPVRFASTEAADALLSNADRGFQLLGRPQVSPDQMIRWIADWLARGGRVLGKPTKFQVRNGKF